MKINHKEKIRCFISYCHEGVERDILEFIIKDIRKITAKYAEILYDIDSVELGERFSDFMGLLNSVDIVFLILTPEYYNKTINKKGGVWKEYSKILTRYEEKIELTKRNTVVDYFNVIPIIFSGHKDKIIPYGLEDVRYIDLSYVRLNQLNDNQFVIPVPLSTNYKNDLDLITKTIASGNQKKYSENINRLNELIQIKKIQSSLESENDNSLHFVSGFLDKMDRLWEDELDIAADYISRNDWLTERAFQQDLDAFFLKYWTVFDALVRHKKTNIQLKSICDTAYFDAILIASNVWEKILISRISDYELRVKRGRMNIELKENEITFKQIQSEFESIKRQSNPLKRIELFKNLMERVDR